MEASTSANANTEHRCVECGVLSVATIVQFARLFDGRVNHWHICGSCARSFEERKDAAEREWRERELELRAALERVPIGQASPSSMRKRGRQ